MEEDRCGGSLRAVAPRSQSVNMIKLEICLSKLSSYFGVSNPSKKILNFFWNNMIRA